MARRFVAALVAALIFVTVLGGCVKNEKPKDTVTTGPIGVIKDEDFGDVFFDITIDRFNALGFDFGDSVNVSFDNGRELKDIPYYSGYYVPVGETLVLGYPGYPHVAVSINYGAATWEEFGMKDDTKVTVTLNEKGKYKATEEFCALDYSDDRASFASDEMFANFREMKGGNIAAAVSSDQLYVFSSELNFIRTGGLRFFGFIPPLLAAGDTDIAVLHSRRLVGRRFKRIGAE